MAPARPKVLSHPRLCGSRTQTWGPSCRAGGGRVRNRRYRIAETGSWPAGILLFIFGRGCEICD